MCYVFLHADMVEVAIHYQISCCWRGKIRTEHTCAVSCAETTPGYVFKTILTSGDTIGFSEEKMKYCQKMYHLRMLICSPVNPLPHRNAFSHLCSRRPLKNIVGNGAFAHNEQMLHFTHFSKPFKIDIFVSIRCPSLSAYTVIVNES